MDLKETQEMTNFLDDKFDFPGLCPETDKDR